jgi:hypothetical protein
MVVDVHYEDMGEVGVQATDQCLLTALLRGACDEVLLGNAKDVCCFGQFGPGRCNAAKPVNAVSV